MRASLLKHPKELWILAVTELCERFSFWGVGNLLVLYLIESYQFPNEKATSIYGIFTGAAAFLPLAGGWIADKWNYQSPLFFGALINAIGCFLIATGVEHLLYVALVVIAIGYGIFTPSILTVLGYTYRNKPDLREAGFSIYYASINVGVFLALISLGTLAKFVSWETAFLTAGVVQVIGLIPLIYYLMKHKETYRGLKASQREAKSSHHPLTHAEKSRLGVIAIFCLVSLVFWAAYNQAFSSMAIFAHSYMDRGNVPEGIFMASESFFLILLAPLLAALYDKLQKNHRDPSPAAKTSLSLFFMAGAFLVMMAASSSIPDGATSASVSWKFLVFSYFLMAVSEMLLAPIGLSMVSKLAPQRYTALMIGVWYACVGLAFFNGGLLAGLMEKMGGLYNFFSIFVIMTLIPAGIMALLVKKLTKWSHLHTDLPHGFTDVDK
jgi:POT family proton-dependent oligopeptide transporter